MINTSLMALKDCIRNRAIATQDPNKKTHIPYRNSKLTLLLKDAFELNSKKNCKTTIIACVAPSVADLTMTKNTLRFIVPIKIAAKAKANTDHLEYEANNPATWTN
jgi:kinesin family member 2/24